MKTTLPLSRKLKAVIDGMAYLWLLMVLYEMIYVMRCMDESQRLHGNFLFRGESTFTKVMTWLFPNATWSVLPSLLLAAAGLTAHSLSSSESSVECLLRWTCVLGFSALGTITIGMLTDYRCLCSVVSDESFASNALSLAVAGAVLWTGLRRLRQVRQL